jgi:Zn-dependent protease
VIDLGLGVIWYGALVFSLTVHEAAHAWAALRGGDPTAYSRGQVSLDPRPHIRREPFGCVVVPILFFITSGWMIGWASTPYDPRWAYIHPKRAGWMALAGPAANLALVIAAALAIRAGLAAGLFQPPDIVSFARVAEAPGGGIWASIAIALSILFTLNLLLCVFNLIPLPPLDGGGAVALLVDQERARRIQAFLQKPHLSFMGILVAWFLIGPLFSPIHQLALNLLYPEVGYR